MAKKQIISTAFDELNQDLDEKEAYFLTKIVTNEWVSKTGIYKLHAVMLAATLGFAKVLGFEEIAEITEEFKEEPDVQKRDRNYMSKIEQLAELRLKNMFDILESKKKLKYDYKKHLMKVNNFHKYVPFGSAKPSIIFAAIVGGMQKNEEHLFWTEYLEENKTEIKNLLITAEATANKSKNPEITLLDPNFLTLKKLIFS